MNITSSYQVRIVNCSVNLIDTVRIYPEALSYLIGVVSENWDAVKSISLNAFIAANILLIHKESGWGFPLPSPLLRVKTVLSPYKVKSEKVRCLHYLSLRICKVKFTCL